MLKKFLWSNSFKCADGRPLIGRDQCVNMENPSRESSCIISSGVKNIRWHLQKWDKTFCKLKNGCQKKVQMIAKEISIVEDDCLSKTWCLDCRSTDGSEPPAVRDHWINTDSGSNPNYNSSPCIVWLATHAGKPQDLWAVRN